MSPLISAIYFTLALPSPRFQRFTGYFSARDESPLSHHPLPCVCLVHSRGRQEKVHGGHKPAGPNRRNQKEFSLAAFFFFFPSSLKAPLYPTPVRWYFSIKTWSLGGRDTKKSAFRLFILKQSLDRSRSPHQKRRDSEDGRAGGRSGGGVQEMRSWGFSWCGRVGRVCYALIFECGQKPKLSLSYS